MADDAQAQDAETPAGAIGSWVDPYRGFNFRLEMGLTESHFAECVGLGAEVEVIEYREGGNNAVMHHIPGSVKYSGVTLRYGLTNSTELWDWMQKVIQGNIERRNVSIVLLKPDGNTEALRWNLIDAWPSAWLGAPLNAMGNEMAIESMTLVFDELHRG